MTTYQTGKAHFYVQQCPVNDSGLESYAEAPTGSDFHIMSLRT